MMRSMRFILAKKNTHKFVPHVTKKRSILIMRKRDLKKVSFVFAIIRNYISS